MVGESSMMASVAGPAHAAGRGQEGAGEYALAYVARAHHQPLYPKLRLRGGHKYSVIRWTYGFRVFELAPSVLDGEHLGWAGLDGLGGEVLFVGGSSSVSLTASEYFRAEAEADCIYFTDNNFHIAIAARWELPCRDIGRYSMRDRSVTFLDVQAPHSCLLPPT